jgi:hypothetical protein
MLCMHVGFGGVWQRRPRPSAPRVTHMCHAAGIRQAAEAGEPIIVMEDDLMLGDTLSVTRRATSEVLGAIPPTADMVYLEFCLESCRKLSHSAAYPRLARAQSPSCAAAIFFSAKGARKVADMCLPILDVIDRMYPALIASGNLEAYVAVPPLFYQDHRFASNWDRGKGIPSDGAKAALEPASLERLTNLHHPAPGSGPCQEAIFGIENLFDAVAPIDRRQVGIRLPHSDLESALNALETDDCRGQLAPTRRDPHARLVWVHLSTPPNLDPKLLPRGSRIVQQTRGAPRGEGQDGKPVLVTVGSSSASSSCGLILHIGNASECWDVSDRGLCVIFASVVLETEAVVEGDSVADAGDRGLSYLKEVSYSLFIVG